MIYSKPLSKNAHHRMLESSFCPLYNTYEIRFESTFYGTKLYTIVTNLTEFNVQWQRVFGTEQLILMLSIINSTYNTRQTVFSLKVWTLVCIVQ